MAQVDHDLPSHGARLKQKANGMLAAVVNGQVLLRDNEHTSALPRRLLRGHWRPLSFKQRFDYLSRHLKISDTDYSERELWPDHGNVGIWCARAINRAIRCD